MNQHRATLQLSEHILLFCHCENVIQRKEIDKSFFCVNNSLVYFTTNVKQTEKMSAHTCLNCNVRFQNPDIQREHYKTDWHRYNLKRRVGELPPVTAEEFQKRVLQQRVSDEQAQQEISLHCAECHKNFISDKSYQNHLNSKKHRENVLLAEKKAQTLGSQADAPMKPTEPKEEIKEQENDVKIEDDMDVEEVDSDEWDEDFDNPIANNDCIFCAHHSEDLVENVKHMSTAHSFFIPDTEYITDLEGLLLYLGEKVTRGKFVTWL